MLVHSIQVPLDHGVNHSMLRAHANSTHIAATKYIHGRLQACTILLITCAGLSEVGKVQLHAARDETTTFDTCKNRQRLCITGYSLLAAEFEVHLFVSLQVAGATRLRV